MGENGRSMIGIVIWILRFTKKEHALVANYRKAHKHFLMFMTVDAFLSFALITTGLHYFGPEAWAAHEKFILKHPGVIPAPVDKFLDYATREREAAFWLGAEPGDLYTYQPSLSGKQTVSYYVRELDSTIANVPTISVTTYRNILVYEENPHITLGTTTKALLSDGKTVEFDTEFLKRVLVTFKNDPSIVSIEYRDTQSIKLLLADSVNLKPLG